jgi:hypothetical protein
MVERGKLHSGELHNLYSSPDIIRQIKSRRTRWVGHVACMGEGRKMYSALVGKPEGKRPLGRLRHRWEDGIRLDLREIGCVCARISVCVCVCVGMHACACGVNSAGSGQGPMAGSCKCGYQLLGSGTTE